MEKMRKENNLAATTKQRVYFDYLQADLLVHSDRPVAEGDGVTEAGLSLDCPLGHVHDNLRALGAGMEEQRAGGQTPAWLNRQAALGLVVIPVGRRRKRSVERICVENEMRLVWPTGGDGKTKALKKILHVAQF